MTKLEAIDLAFSKVESNGVRDGDWESSFQYPNLQHLTLRYAPCYMIWDGGSPSGSVHPPSDLAPMFGCEGSRADMDVWMTPRLQFFILAAKKLRSLQLLHELGLEANKAYLCDGWPMSEITELLHESNPLERLVIENPLGDGADSDDGNMGNFIATFKDTLHEIDLTYDSCKSWEDINKDLFDPENGEYWETPPDEAFESGTNKCLQRFSVTKLVLDKEADGTVRLCRA